eukprot:156878_1
MATLGQYANPFGDPDDYNDPEIDDTTQPQQEMAQITNTEANAYDDPFSDFNFDDDNDNFNDPFAQIPFNDEQKDLKTKPETLDPPKEESESPEIPQKDMPIAQSPTPETATQPAAVPSPVHSITSRQSDNTTRSDTKLEKLAQNNALVFIGVFVVFGLSVTALYLTVVQASVTVVNERFDEYDCPHDSAELIYPFSVTFNDADVRYGCPWRTRNTFGRIVVIGVLTIFCVAALVMLCITTNTYECDVSMANQRRVWFAFACLYWLLWIATFIVFIIDSDGLHSGFSSCLEDFIGLGGTAGAIDQCFLIPFVWVPVLDISLCISCYALYKIIITKSKLLKLI